MAWTATEAKFHLAAHDWLREGAASTRVYPDSRRQDQDHETLVFFDQGADSLLKIDQMKLIRSVSPRPLRDRPLIFVSMSSGGSVGEPWGFYLSLEEDRGWIEIPEPDVDSWKGYELAPETVHALKQRVFTLKQNENGQLFTP